MVRYGHSWSAIVTSGYLMSAMVTCGHLFSARKGAVMEAVVLQMLVVTWTSYRYWSWNSSAGVTDPSICYLIKPLSTVYGYQILWTTALIK